MIMVKMLLAVMVIVTTFISNAYTVYLSWLMKNSAMFLHVFDQHVENILSKNFVFFLVTNQGKTTTAQAQSL